MALDGRERRSVADADAERAVLRALAARGGTAALADVVVDTALPEATVAAALTRLLEQYDSSVGVAKGGALVYRFARGAGGRFRARRERRPGLRAALRTLAVVSNEIAIGVRVGFRTVLALQLLVYTFALLAPISAVIGAIVGVVLLIAAILGGGDGSGLEALADPYVLGFVVGCAMLYGIYLGMKKQRDVLLALVGKETASQGRMAGFVKQVNDFALGPEQRLRLRERLDRTWTISQADERRVLARVRRQGGALRAGDLVDWLGLSLAEADRQATRLCVEYDGEPAADGVADEAAIAVVEFRFPSLMETAGSARKNDDVADEATAHERPVVVPRLTGNTVRQDTAIFGFAALNLIAGLVGRWLIGRHVAGGTEHPTWWAIGRWGAGLVPAGFALLVIALWLLRVPVWRWRVARAQRKLERVKIMTALVAHARRHGEQTYDLDQLAVDHDVVRGVALELEGSFDLDARQKTVWRFPRLAAELSRRGRPAVPAGPQPVGQLVYES